DGRHGGSGDPGEGPPLASLGAGALGGRPVRATGRSLRGTRVGGHGRGGRLVVEGIVESVDELPARARHRAGPGGRLPRGPAVGGALGGDPLGGHLPRHGLLPGFLVLTWTTALGGAGTAPLTGTTALVLPLCLGLA